MLNKPDSGRILTTMKRSSITNLLFIITFSLISCSTRYIGPEFYKFKQATELLGKNIVYIFAELMNEEMELLRVAAVKKDTVKPQDFEPSILNVQQIELRKELIRYITNYTGLLLEVFEYDNAEEIKKKVHQTQVNLDSINKNHNNFLTEKETGIITTITGAITEAVNYTRKREVVLSLMKNNQKILDKIIPKLKDELKITQLILKNIFNRQFLEAVESLWPQKINQRVKYSKIALKIIQRKNKINIILQDLIKAIDIIPMTHLELYSNLKNHQNIYRRLSEFVNFSYRIQQNYAKYAKLGEN